MHDSFKQGLVRISNSPYVASIVMARKFDGYIRVCVDYKSLNECTAKHLFPLPRIDDLFVKLRNAKCMTHLDLRSAYNQVQMSNDGLQDDFLAATTSHSITPNGASCLHGAPTRRTTVFWPAYVRTRNRKIAFKCSSNETKQGSQRTGNGQLKVRKKDNQKRLENDI